MSEEIDLTQSHLCTTEDAFEKFQAGSMYEEDEFITLSDIVSPPHAAPDFSGEYNDIPYENEVVLDSKLEEQVPEVNSTIEISTEEVISSETPLLSEVRSEAVEDVLDASTKKRQPAKRGRKKKSQAVESYTNNLDKQNGTCETVSQDSEAVALARVQRRRGRPPKNVSPSQQNSIAADTVVANHKTPANVLKRNKRDSLSDDKILQNNKSMSDDTPLRKVPAKRGRQKQNITEHEPDLSVSRNESEQQDNINKESEIVLPSRKRGRKKKLIGKDESLYDTEVKDETEKPDDLPAEQPLSDTSLEASNKKTPGKRGRPKRNQLKVKSETDTNQLEDSIPKEDDDADDICLSQLKDNLDGLKDSISHETSALEIDSKNGIIDNNVTPMDVNEELPSESIKNSLDKSKNSCLEDKKPKENTETKRNSDQPVIEDFEHNIDSIMSEKKEVTEKTGDQNVDKEDFKDSLLVEDTSKRPVRRKAKQPLLYDEGSDEDPFANIELSDEDDMKGRKGRYYSDDEYIPGLVKKRGSKHIEVPVDSDSSDSDIDNDDDLISEIRKRKRKSDGSPCKKRGRKSKDEKDRIKPEVSTVKPVENVEGDVENCLQTSVIKVPEESKKWGTTNEFENFLAKKIQGTEIKIKKASAAVQPLEIPVLDPNEIKKTKDTSAQTAKIQTSSASVQTSAPYDVPMTTNVSLTAEQSEKACEFLNSIVKTTAELGELMTQKSEDFIKKKINTNHVTDTFKMDYCVRKSFLLFKLAKHNLMQMEEDLAKQYDNFLNIHNLSQYREKPEVLEAKQKAKDSDSDCEIVETPAPAKSKKTPVPFNPKTVFLNKELSIKIAKKPTEDKKPTDAKKLNIKGRHTVWINDSVMVKKVKPTQSFLAQDSRNKKPPDYVTIEMVNAFFKQYYRDRALTTCAPFVSSEWMVQKRLYMCNYFFTDTEDFPTNSEIPSGSGHCDNDDRNLVQSHDNSCVTPVQDKEQLNPKTLLSLCTQAVQSCHNLTKLNFEDMLIPNTEYHHNYNQNPKTLYQLCLDSINKTNNAVGVSTTTFRITPNQTPSKLKSLCYKLIVELMQSEDNRSTESRPESPLWQYENQFIIDNVRSDFTLFQNGNQYNSSPSSHLAKYEQTLPSDVTNKNRFSKKTATPLNGIKSLFSLSISILNKQLNCITENEILLGNEEIHYNDELRDVKYNPQSLKKITCKCLLNLVNRDAKISRRKAHKSAPIKISDKYTTISASKQVKSLADLCFQKVTKAFSDNDNMTTQEGLTIDAVNTLSEEAYHEIHQSEFSENEDDYYPDDDNHYEDEDETESGIHDSEAGHVENNWLSQVQLQVSSCYDTANSTSVHEQPKVTKHSDPIVPRIKLEPVDEILDAVDTSIVKSEPISHLDEMTIIPENIVTKSEFLESAIPSREPVQRQNSSSYDVDQFEAFVSTNKMMSRSTNYQSDDEIFSQSASRIRRQFEPDSDTENDANMSLLVPQTYESIPVIEKDKLKDSLMESSSDESSTSNNKKVVKKKPEKRGRRKKKIEAKPTHIDTPVTTKDTPTMIDSPTKNKDIPTKNKEPLKEGKPVAPNEIVMLTRRMREKIRQEEKKVASSDSEHETETLVPKKGKEKLNKLKVKGAKVEALVNKEKQHAVDETDRKETKSVDDEIQCSNVDSTQLSESFGTDARTTSPSGNKFTGFSAVDQNEIYSYQKYVKYVYDQILPKVSDQGDDKTENSDQPVINPNEPVELLECVPTMPFFMDESSNSLKTNKKRKGKDAKVEDIAENNLIQEKPSKTSPTRKAKAAKPDETKENKQSNANSTAEEENNLYVNRHGWKCYPLDGNDMKLYQNAQILLEKLPESFVETYFQYQGIKHKSKDDEEVDKLTNLQTLNRSATKEGVAESKTKCKVKLKQQVKDAVFSILGMTDADGDSKPASPDNSEHYTEFSPSEDEGGDVNDEISAPVSKPASENNLAKNSLMDDNDSDGETKIKEEPGDPDEDSEANGKSSKKPGPKSKKVKEKAPAQPVMLTADKMMNKELNLLHAPVNLDDDDVKINTPAKSGPVTRNKQKSASKKSPTDRAKAEDDSSSEEEKQWFTIKEKLLKRMVKKHDTTREDDAKRAKLVSEFIERRGDGTESYIKKRRGPRGRRSKKKLLERQKQLKVLTRELFGDSSNDTSLQRKKQAVAYFKGRRNIRKVLDKKSLAKSTVVANMEEFERKRRLNIRQSRLREVLGCEEGVNVLVINDEVCLEYDFEQQRPVVTIHPFFTKVMKAHQYEGVKFMWDACFESLANIRAGEPGGGCILAHCMGLGKTLQVLALLHTVLTHPGVGMQRVLVCCPLSTVLNWVDEIHKWIGPVTNQIKVFELSKLRKTYERAYQLEDWYNGGGIFIIGYELFRSLTTLDPFLDDVRPTIINKIRTALLDPGPDIIICDEGHLLKNDCSVLAVAMSRVATRRRVVLTGTPMQNNLREYYCMVNFVKPNLLGTYAEYSNRFENPIMNGQHRDSREEDIKLMKARTHILHKVLEGCLQRQEASVLYPYLPKKHEYTVFISLTKCQWDLYKHYLQNYGNTQNNKSILKDFHILQKIWSHPQVLHNFQMRVCDDSKAKNKVKVEKLEDDLASEDLKETVDVKLSDNDIWWLQYLEGGAMLDSLSSSNKFAAVFRILEESVALGDKVLIFSTSLFTMDALEFFLKKINNWSLGQEYYRLDGSVPPEVRQKWCREFNAENNLKTKLFLISTRAGSLGLNMTAANRVIILDTSWNPAHDIQSIFRVYRFGQKKDCYIYRLVALGTMEQKIYERSVTKQAVACRVVDEQQIDRHYNMAELTELYKYDEHGVGVAGGVAVGVEDVVLLRVARDAALHAVHEHDSLLRGSGEQGLPEHERNAAWMQFQQEHANKQMQEDALQKALLEAEQLKALQPEAKPEPKRNTKKVVKIKIPIKEETIEESILPEPMPPPLAPHKPRGRKPKHNNAVSCRIPIQPENPPDPEESVAMVKKIAEILHRHHFNNMKTPDEISDLVSRVRDIVYSGQIDMLDCTDNLTMNIANVFMQKRRAPMPALTDVIPEPLPGPSVVKQEPESLPEIPAIPPKPPPRQRGRKKGSGKKKFVYVDEEIPSTSKAPPVEIPDFGRTRRQAAIAAERNFDQVADTAVEVDNDWQNDDDWQDDHDDHDSDSPISDMKAKETEKRQKKLYDQQEDTKNIIPLLPAQDETILLSDDDEPPPPRRKPGPARRKTQVNDTPPPEPPKEAKKENKPLIPLHPSLLSNKNFIKIVAHTYLSGNPMLDEDAATLAAEYSTFKTLKGYESSGKDIVSGPIYDIAVQVLGNTVLEKLHTSNPQSKEITQELITQHPINAKETARSKESASSKRNATIDSPPPLGESPPPEEIPVKPAEEQKKPVKIKIRIPPLPAKLAAAGDAAAANKDSGNVVPVGLYKRAEERPDLTADECILPDDDDIRIISDPTPPAPAPAPAAPKPITINRRNTHRFIVHNVTSKAPSPSPTTSTPKVAPVSLPRQRPEPKTPTPAPAPQPLAPAAKEILSDWSATISLDSDDDEPPAWMEKPAPAPPASAAAHHRKQPAAPAPAPAPVPVSLTQVDPAGRKIHTEILKLQPTTEPGSTLPGMNIILVPNYMNSPVPVALTAAGGTSSYNLSSPAVPVVLSSAGGAPGLTQSPMGPSLNVYSRPSFTQQSLAVPSTPRPKLTMVSAAAVPPALKMTLETVRTIAKPAQTPKPAPAAPKPAPAAPKPAPAAPKPAPMAPKPPQTSQQSKRVCKPGDIVRFNSDGQVQVLNRLLKPTTETPPKPQEPAQKGRSLLKQSTSKDNDPLSILKDVIHIEADNYDTATPAPQKRDTIKTPAKPKEPTSDDKWQVLSHSKTDKTYKNRKLEQSQPKNPESQAKEIMVDLTDLDVPAPPAKPKALKGATTIVGTSKSIILCGSGKAVVKSNSNTTSKNVEPSSVKNKVEMKNKPEMTKRTAPNKPEVTKRPAPNKPEVTKRPAPIDTSSTKKKKTEKPMTLKDFNIDDFDDIIELE